jgi:hypothetical protein
MDAYCSCPIVDFHDGDLGPPVDGLRLLIVVASVVPGVELFSLHGLSSPEKQLGGPSWQIQSAKAPTKIRVT